MLIDSTIVARAGGFAVIAEHKLVTWPDGSAIALHQVRHESHLDGTHLALRLPDTGAWLVFEVGPIDPALAQDLRAAHWHDWPGLVFFHLRSHYDSADALRKAVLDQAAHYALRARVRDVRRAA
jgi:hypothetical protein